MENFWQDLTVIIQSYYDEFLVLFPRLALAVLILLFFFFTARYVQKLANNRLNSSMEDELMASFLARSIKTIYWIIGFLLILQVLELTAIAGSLLAGAGISAIILGFAFKDIGENFLAGMIMAFRRPFRQGDIIESGGVQGRVLRLSIRDTQVKTVDGKDVFIPNGQILKNPLFNYTIDGYLRYGFVVGLDYDSDINNGVKVILGALEKIEGVLKEEKAPAVTIDELAASTINLNVYFWINDFDPRTSIMRVRMEAMQKTVEALVAAGYYLPSDIVEIKNYHDFDLKTTYKDGKIQADAG